MVSNSETAVSKRVIQLILDDEGQGPQVIGYSFQAIIVRYPTLKQIL